MIKIGDKVTFDCLRDIKVRGTATGEDWVVGKVIEVHTEHNWFAVEYPLGEDDTRLRTSFHFCDIGDAVFVQLGRG